MDDFPAGPPSTRPRPPRLSVVIPVRDGARDLGRCLRGIRETPDLDAEVIVVDDGSTDDSAVVAAWYGAIVLKNESPRGPAAARNAGAGVATGSLLVFVDADVAVHPDAIPRIVARFDADPGLVALFGSYDDRPEAPGLVSRYRNLLHHFVHQNGPFVDDLRPVRTFWTGLGAIRRDAFLGQGGFDPTRYRRPAIEDIEFGYRITRAGGRIVLSRDVRATHLKRWSLLQTVRTDIFQRGVPWLLLMRRSGVDETDLNVDLSGRVSVAATGIAGLSAMASTIWPTAGPIAVACVAVVVALNLRFYRFLAKTGGAAFALACLPLHLIYFACCGASVLIATALWHGGLNRAEARTTRGLRRDGPDRPAPKSTAKDKAARTERTAR